MIPHFFKSVERWKNFELKKFSPLYTWWPVSLSDYVTSNKFPVSRSFILRNEHELVRYHRYYYIYLWFFEKYFRKSKYCIFILIPLNPCNSLYIYPFLKLLLFLEEQQVRSSTSEISPLDSAIILIFSSTWFFPLSRPIEARIVAPGVGTVLSNVSFASFASFVEDYQRRGGSISLRVAGWATPHPWQARAKQMSHCHAKGSPLTCNVSLGNVTRSFVRNYFFFLERGARGRITYEDPPCHSNIDLFLFLQLINSKFNCRIYHGANNLHLI